MGQNPDQKPVSGTPEFDMIAETLGLLADWEDRYAFLIDLGRKLPSYPEDQRDDAHKVPGCTSQVWMAYQWKNNALFMDVDSDAHLVKGLLAILVALYQGRSPAQIMAVEPAMAFERLGLEGHLSPNRRNGFFAVATRIGQLARANL